MMRRMLWYRLPTAGVHEKYIVVIGGNNGEEWGWSGSRIVWLCRLKEGDSNLEGGASRLFDEGAVGGALCAPLSGVNLCLWLVRSRGGQREGLPPLSLTILSPLSLVGPDDTGQ